MDIVVHRLRPPSLVLPLVLLCALPAFGEYQLRKVVFSGGAVETDAGSYALRATLGEAGIVGHTAGGAYVLHEGFWSPIYFSPGTDVPIPESAIQWANGLRPGFPNPFRSEANIVFTVKNPSPVRLTVYDIAGRRVRTLVDEVRLPGRHRVIWAGRDNHGQRVASGVYFCRLEVGRWSESRRLLRLR